MSSVLTRRGIFLATAAATLFSATRAQAELSRSFTEPSFDRLLARRVSTGACPELLAEISSVGATPWLASQLNPAGIDDSAFEQYAARFSSRNLAISALNKKILRNSSLDRLVRTEIQCEHLARLMWSRRQLQAQLTDLWANHFNIPVQFADGIGPSRAHFQAKLRRGCLGKFSDLLISVTTHPAMLTYLGNRWSTKRHPNENHGRELLELHSVGFGAFTEDDVESCTRLLTGFSVADDTEEFRYRPETHWIGPIQICGWSDLNAADSGGLIGVPELCRALAQHPATAIRICRKLAQSFVADDPSPEFVDRLARTYLSRDTSIAAVLRQLFASPEFAAGLPLTRRPLDAIVASTRLLGLRPESSGYIGVRGLVDSLANMGQSPLNCAAPDGFPLEPSQWGATSATLERWNVTYGIVDGTWPAELQPGVPLLHYLLAGQARPGTYGAIVDAVSEQLFGLRLPDDDRSALLTFVAVAADTPAGAAADRWAELPQLVAALLDSPYHLYR